MSIELFSLDTLQEFARLYGYWAVFVGIAIENMGIPLPGETIVIVGGFLAGSGELNYGWVLSSAIAGAVLGDNFGYWVGRVGGWQLLVKIGRIFRLQEQQLEQAKDRYSKNAVQAVVWATTIVTLSFFLGKIVSLEQIVSWIAQIGVVALLLVVAFLLVPIIWQYGNQKLFSKD